MGKKLRIVFQKKMSETKKFIHEKFKQEIHRCRELKILRTRYGYYHHVFVGEVSESGCDLYHYQCAVKPYFRWRPPGQITKVILNFADEEVSSEIQAIFNIDGGDKVDIFKRKDYPQNRKAEDVCIKKAESRLGEEKYSLSYNNCESYVNWIFSSDDSSNQANSCTKNKLVSNGIDGEVSRGVEHPLKQTLSGIIHSWKTLKKYVGSIFSSICDLLKKIKEEPAFLINICKELLKEVKRKITEINFKKLFLRAEEFIKTVATLQKNAVINGLQKIVEKGNQLMKALAEAGTNVGTIEFRKMFEKSKQFMKRFVEESKNKLAEKVEKSHSPAALQFAIGIETICLVIALYSIYDDNIMTTEQKAQGYGRELFSSLFGVIGSTIGQLLIPIPIVGSLVGGVIGNVAGGAFGGTLFSSLYTCSLFQHPFAHLELQNLE